MKASQHLVSVELNFSQVITLFYAHNLLSITESQLSEVLCCRHANYVGIDTSICPGEKQNKDKLDGHSTDIKES